MKNKILVVSFLIIIYGFFFLNLMVYDLDISKSERRRLQEFPEVSLKNIFNKDFMDDFDKYSVDQFVFRDLFRNIKASYSFNILGMLDNNGYFEDDGYLFKNLYPTNKKSINSFISKMNMLNDYFDSSNNVYFGIIPDKNYYLDNSKYLRLDYDYLYNRVKGNVPYKFIDLRDSLSLDNYYYTDTHWRQEMLEDVVFTVNKSMGNDTTFNYKENKYSPFYGVYYGQAALNVDADELVYLTNDMLNNVDVDEMGVSTQLYNKELLDGMDSYDVFLNGATPLIKITNPNSKTDKELVLFRDSFGSSIAPLLVENYKSITLVDMRYMNMSLLKENVDLKNKDILILYSTLIINDSSTLKIY